DVDMVLDMRFMPNPFYIPALRPLSGLDAPVREFVLAQPQAPEFFDTLESHIRRLLPLYIAQDKRIFRICFGCTGGRHRSVAAAAEMARRFAGGEWNVRAYHRDIGFEAADIRERFRARS
ncbi:MAG: RNase adapter RapZ, partial [Clostridia bacterium]|nr:RNase adapter RapZ [Clostridia bacterium]